MGRKQGIKMWDLKVLAALSLGMRIMAKSFQIQVSKVNVENIDRCIEPLFWTGSDLSNGREFAKLCLKIKGKENFMFNPFRVKLHKMFHHNTLKVLSMIKDLHLKFYGCNIDKDLEDKICKNFVSPLVVILQFISDGHLIDTGNLDYLDRLVNSFSRQRFQIESFEIENKIQPSRLRTDGIYISCGECLIINQIYEKDSKIKREGTMMDEAELVKTFEYLGCKNNIMIERDLTRSEIIQTLKKFRLKLQTSAPDFIAIIILSHGKRDVKTGEEYIMDINLKALPMRIITNMFVDGYKCPSMVGKPKLFFVQACRGSAKQESQKMNIRLITFSLNYKFYFDVY